MVEPAHEIKLLDLREYSDNPNYRCILFEQTKDYSLLRLLEEEKRKMGIVEREIFLLLPEKGLCGLVHNLDSDKMGGVVKLVDNTYQITLYPLALKKAKEIFGYDPTSLTIRHELAHIKFGDCDRKFPTGFKWLQRIYNYFIEEPRARAYAHNHS